MSVTPQSVIEPWFEYWVLMVIIGGLIWYAAVPYAALRLGGPLSRRAFTVRMLLYTAAVIIINIMYKLSVYNEADHMAESFIFTYLEKMPKELNFAFAFIIPAVWCIISEALFFRTRYIDVRMPAEYSHVRPVKAKVVKIESITEVEYNEKTYVMSKDFPFSLRDTIRVRIIDGREDCYLA